MRTRLLLAFLLMGFTLTISQTILVRELLISFSGSEIVIGLVLGNWLLWEAIGSGWLGRLADRVPTVPETFGVLQLLLVVSLTVSLLLAASIRSILQALPGEALDLGMASLGSLLTCIVLGLVDGAMFTFGCAIYAQFFSRDRPTVSGETPTAHVYALEATGAILGGIVLTYWLLPYLSLARIALLLTTLNGLSAASLTQGHFRRKTGMVLFVCALFLAAFGLLALVSPLSTRLTYQLARSRWDDQELLESADSLYGNLAVIRQEEQLTFFVDGMPIITAPTPDILDNQSLVHLPILLRPSPRRVLIISGGVGGVLHEVLKYASVESVDYIELDPLLIELVRRYPTPLTAAELADPRVKVHSLDGRRYVRQLARSGEAMRNRYDLVLLNLPYPSTLLINRYYTHEFYALIRDLLAAEGVLVLNLPGSTSYLGEELRDLNRLVESTLRSVFPEVYVIVGERNLWLASPGLALGNVSIESLQAQWRQANIAAEAITPEYISYRFDPQQYDWFQQSLAQAPTSRPNSDLWPSGIHYGLRYWNALLSQGWPHVLAWTASLDLWHIVLLSLGSALLLSLWRWRTGRASCLPIFWAVGSTGFLGMSIDLTAILALQALQGYVYQQVGLLVGAFMAGLALGSLSVTQRLSAHQASTMWLLAIEFVLACYCGLTAITLKALFAASGTLPPIATLVAINVAAGTCVGLEFPVANRLLLQRGGTSHRVAGQLYALDLIGAFVASLVVPVILVPVLGTLNTLVVLTLLKAGSLTLAATQLLTGDDKAALLSHSMR